jgi:hypothetical protein
MEVLKVMVAAQFGERTGVISKVHRSLTVNDSDDLSKIISLAEVNGLKPEIIDGI